MEFNLRIACNPEIMRPPVESSRGTMCFPARPKDNETDAANRQLTGQDRAALRFAAALLLALAIFWAAPSHAGANTEIFMLHSYSQEYPWTKRQHEGFLRRLGAMVPGTIAPSIEYLDTKRVPYTAAYADFLAAHLAQKYAGFEPALIYVTDDNALSFALTHLTRIFPKAPIFFSGINDYEMKKRIDPHHVTGVFENKEIAPNLELMRHLAPGVREILVVGDESETFQSIRREIVSELARQPDIRAQFLSGGRIEQLVASLQGRKEQFVFLTTLGAMVNAQGRTLALHETIEAIVRAGQFTVISMEDVYLFPGVLGGYVTSGHKQGDTAAGMCARYLSGAAITAIKPVEVSPNEFIIDGSELEKLGLTLPPDLARRTTILNPVPTFYERHLTLIVRSLYVFSLLFVVSVAASLYMLVRKNRQIARNAAVLAEQAELMSEVQESHVRAQRIAHMGNWDWHIQDNTLYWSEGIYQLFHVARSALVGSYDALLATVHPRDRKQVGDAVQAALEQGVPYDLTHRIMLPDGVVRVVHQSGEVTRDAVGKPQRMIATILDVTEQTRAEQALRESEVKLRTVIEGFPVVLWAVDREGIFTLSRGAGLAALGLAPDEVVGKSLFDLYRDNPHIIAGTRRALAGESHVSNDWIGAHAFETHFSPQHDRSGAIVGATAVSTDVTERNQSENALRESERRFRNFFEKNSSVMLLMDPDSGRVIEANEAAAAYYGYSAARLVSMNVGDINTLPPERVAEERRKAAREERSHFLFVHRLASGEMRDVEVYSTPIESSGRTLLLSIIHDITERKRAEAARVSLETQLRESQKMEAIGTLAGGIAHDFNNILATILGNTELAREDASTNALAIQSLEEIRKASERGRNLVQQILSFSRREPTTRKLAALGRVVEESVRLLRAVLPARLVLDVYCEVNLPSVLADSTQIQQVVINLATNAMQAMPSGPGHIRIRLDTVPLDAAMAEAHPELRAMHAGHTGRAVRLAVSDDGPGMDTATLARIFEPFFTTKAVNEGTGLGLSVVHGIVLTHEGAIVVDSQLGKGTTFTIYLPVTENLAGAHASEESEIAATSAAMRKVGNGRHILYLDDDESLVFLVTRLLERRGFRVSGYTDQREALAALRADPSVFDLVVTDYNMPGMSGLDVARAVRTIHANLPVAIASGFIDETLQSQAEGAGVRELIFKADAVEELCEAFARLAQVVGNESTNS